MNRNDKQWDPTFFSTAFRLKEGQVSPVIKSKYGYHIIQMVSRNGDDIIVRHILRIPQITDPGNTGGQPLNWIPYARMLVSGALGFGEAVAKFSDDDLAKSTAGQIMSHEGSTFLKIDDLDKDMVLLLKSANLTPGQYSKPTVFTDDRGKKGVRVVLLVSKSEPHRESLKADYNRLGPRALEEKKSAALEKMVPG